VSPGTPSGGKRAGDSGWSGRMMWLGPKAYSWAGPVNAGVTYMYSPTQSGSYGDDVRWKRSFVAGSWQNIKACYRMNTIGRANGSLHVWFNRRLVVNNNSFRYRTRSNVAVSHLMWHIFRGGDSSEWASSKSGYVDIDNVDVTGIY
jgi:hypothetical protein